MTQSFFSSIDVLSRTRNLAASKKTFRWVFFQPFLAQHRRCYFYRPPKFGLSIFVLVASGVEISRWVYLIYNCKCIRRVLIGIGLNPFITAVPFWGQTTWNLSGFPPKRSCGSKRVKGVDITFYWRSETRSMRPHRIQAKPINLISEQRRRE